jgi:hypothetical protein
MMSSSTGAGFRDVLPIMIAARATAAVRVKTMIPVFRMIVLSETEYLSATNLSTGMPNADSPHPHRNRRFSVIFAGDYKEEVENISHLHNF